jgi:hypothetical protein
LAHEGGTVVSPTHRPPLPAGNIPGTHFCWRLSRPQSHNAAGRMSMKISNDTIGNRSRDLPVCSAVPQPLRHCVPPLHNSKVLDIRGIFTPVSIQNVLKITWVQDGLLHPELPDWLY